MVIYSVYTISKAGGLIYQYDHNVPKLETEKTFSFPMDITLQQQNKRIVVAFGHRDGIRVGMVLLAVNGLPVTGIELESGQDVLEMLSKEENYPLNLKFGWPHISTNEKIFLASMYHSLYAISSQLSPESRSSGIEMMEADTFKLYCYQTLTGIKFIVVADPKQLGMEAFLKKVYELYSDYALKNPFYSLDMPIRCELFDNYLQQTVEQVEKTGISNV